MASYHMPMLPPQCILFSCFLLMALNTLINAGSHWHYFWLLKDIYEHECSLEGTERGNISGKDKQKV